MTGNSPNLDLIRAVAVLCVLVAHLIDGLAGSHSELTWHLGQLGVLIFFVHTSCVLMWSLERSALTRTGRALITDFYLRRAFRIYPLAIACVTLAFIAGGWGVFTYLTNLTLTFNLLYQEPMWGGLWTLPLEVQMYAALPLLFLFLRARSLVWLGPIWLVAVAFGLLQPIVPGSGRFGVFAYGPCFLAGVLAWRVSHLTTPRWSGRLWPVVFAATWAVWFVAPRTGHMPYRWAFCLTLGALLPHFKDIPRWLGRLAKPIATYSYGIYLSHIALIAFVVDLHLAPVATAALLGSLLIVVPIALFHAIEQPMMSLGARIGRQRQPHSVLVPASH